MTMEPLKPPKGYPDEVSCPIHEDALKEIKGIVLETRTEVRHLKELGGPIAKIEKTADTSYDMGKRAHRRIDKVESDIDKMRDEQTKLIVKVATIVAVLSTAANFGLAHLF